MENKKLRTFDYNGEQAYFNSEVFKRLFMQGAKNEKQKIGAYENTLAEALHVSASTIHAWRQGQNGPNDLELIQSIAKYFELNDMSELLIIETEERIAESLTDRQIDAVKRIYDRIIEFFEFFRQTDGFCSLLSNIPDHTGNIDIIDVLDHVDKWVHTNVELQYEKEWIDLHDTAIYTELGDYIYDYLREMYEYPSDEDDELLSFDNYLKAQNDPSLLSIMEEKQKEIKERPNKISYEYRFERPLMDVPGGKSVSDELDEAEIVLTDLIQRYL